MIGESSASLSEKNAALRVINGIEAGTLSASDAFNILKDRDPVFVYFMLRYLREKYPKDHPQAVTLQQRLIELTGTYDELRKMHKTGETDPMREWFDDTHSIRDFSRDPEGYVDLIIDKLEG